MNNLGNYRFVAAISGTPIVARGVLVHRSLDCFYISSVNLVSGLPDLLYPLNGFHIVAACAQRLRSSPTTCPDDLHVISCVACDTFFIYALFLMPTFLVWSWSLISNISLSIFLCATCNYPFLFLFLLLGECPCWGFSTVMLGVCTCSVFHF